MKILHLSGNRISDKGIKYLSIALQNNEVKIQNFPLFYFKFIIQTLRELELFDNRITANGGQYLEDLLENNEVKITNISLFKLRKISNVRMKLNFTVIIL